MAIDDFVKFRKQVELLKEKALDFVDNEAEAFYLLTVAAEEIKLDHLSDVDDELGEEYGSDDDEIEDDEEDEIEGSDDEVEDDKMIQEQAFKINKPSMELRGSKNDKTSNSKTSNK